MRKEDWGLARGALPLAMALALAACGGGGGNVRSDPPPANPDSPPSGGGGNQAQPAIDDHLALTSADAAHAAGHTGAGVTIGFVDTGINRNHPTLAGRVLANFVHVDASENNLTVDDVVGHGTTVAQLAAGKAFGQWPGGIAPDATVVSSRIISDDPPEDDGSGEGNEVSTGQGYGAFFAAINAELADAGATIINNSWGGLYWDDPAVTVEFADAYRDFVITRGGLVVFANGNAGDDPALRANPSDNAALPSKDGLAGDLEQGWITVGALDPLHPTQLTDYSQACGVAMDYCMVAPGDVVFTGADDTAGNPSYWVGGGTSYAAPLVSGAAAVVWSAFPYFDNDLVRQTLLGTANDLGAPGVDAVFGHGLLDVAEAARGPSRFDWGDVTVDFAGSSIWGNQISGAGGLVKRGSGTLVLGQDSSYSGDTRIEGGTVQLGAGMSGSDFFVGAAGTLAGRGTIDGDVRNDGHLLVSGQSTQALQLGGDYVQGADGWLDAWVGSSLQVGGSAVLEGGTLNVLGVYSGYTLGTRETMLHAAGGVSGNFDALTAATGVFLEGTLEYDANNVFVDITRLDVTVAAQAMDLSDASQSGAGLVETAFRALDAGAQPGVAPAFVQAAGALQSTRNAAAAERSLASLSGELHGADAALALLAVDGSRRELEARVDAPLRTQVWGANLDDRRSIGGTIGADMRGWMLGQEFDAGGATWGTAFSRSQGTLWNRQRQDRSQDVQVEGQVYGFRNNDAGTYLLGRAAFGRIQRDLQREVLLGDTRHGVEARYADEYVSLGMQAGRHFDVMGGSLTPYAGAQSLHLQRGAFHEDGAAGFGLDAGKSAFDITQALVGTRYQQRWNAGPVQLSLNAHAEWQRTLSQHGAIEASFTALDARAPLALDMLGDNVGILGLGLNAHWNAMRLTLDLDARRGQSRTDLGLTANWAVSF
ncbi:MAG: S8 family serine peptidase [Pseudomonadota bacterium]|nr:S8 family serine peptidase [Pseudomonadota bacterium]